MKKRLILSVLLVLAASSLLAQRVPPPPPAPPIQLQRTVYIIPYESCAAAIAPPTVIATGDKALPCFQVAIAYGPYAVPPQKSPIQWHEFTAPVSNDSWCAGISMRSKFTSPAACAAFWYDRLAPSYEYIGIMTTEEKTQCLWWYND